jgi:MSHA biogenesis protein MshM
MYYAHFGLKEPPFKITPNTEVFFTGGNRGAVLDALIYAITNGEGIVKVVGEVGSGKTMLCRMLQTILPEKIESIFLANPSVAPEDVLHAIAFELQLKLPKNADRLKVMQVLQTHLLARHAAGKQVVIFVEEAQGMPLATLEEIRLLSNLETKHDKLLQIVLFGQPELDENLNQANIRQLRERITHSFNLAPLETKEIGEYLMFRLRAAGYFGPPMFSASAVKKLANAADGLVRRVNILADKALLAAFAENVYEVTPKHVQAAISDSEFGVEAAKKLAKNTQMLMWAGLLALGLALGYTVSVWLQKPRNADAETQVPITSSGIKKSGLETSTHKPSSTNENAPANIAQVIGSQTVNAQVSQDILTSRLTATHAWLASENPSTVTIQLMGASSETQLKSDLEVLSQQVELDNIYIYRTKVNGLPFLTVLYGSFANRVDAMQALKKLPLELQKNRPQLRTVAGVQQETK